MRRCRPCARAPGPAVCTIGTSSSAAMMWASEVLPRPGRACEQHVVERLAPPAGRLDEDPELLGDLSLVDEILELRRPQRSVEVVVRADGPGVMYDDLVVGDAGGAIAGSPAAPHPGVARRAAHAASRGLRPRGAAQGRLHDLLRALALRAVEKLLRLGRRVAQVEQALAGQRPRVLVRGGAGAVGDRPRSRRRPSREARR